jgi:hypothetical protein
MGELVFDDGIERVLDCEIEIQTVIQSASVISCSMRKPRASAEKFRLDRHEKRKAAEMETDLRNEYDFNQ